MYSLSRARRLAICPNHTYSERLHGDSWLVAGGFGAFLPVPRGGLCGSSAMEGAARVSSRQTPTHSLTYSLIHSPTYSPPHSLIHSLIHSLTHSLTHSSTHSPP